MSFKYNKAYSDRLSKISSTNTSKHVTRPTPRKVVLSRKLGNCSEKSCSTGILTNKPNSNRTRKGTKSDVSISSRYTGKSFDYCKKCGDTSRNTTYISTTRDSNPPKVRNANSTIIIRNDVEVSSKYSSENGRRNGNIKINGNGKSKSVKQYYKNENFRSNDSIHETENDFRRMSLDTIKELPETHVASDNIQTMAEDNVFEIYSDSEDVGFLDVNDSENIENLKKFRDNNYFECHSVKSRVDSKGSAISLSNHKCVYRFYLNDRLFPIPLSTDHHDNVRCVECHLPMELNVNPDVVRANGTIQAKVKLDDKNGPQDMILFIPVKDSLIIKERRKQIKKEDDVVYFGVIKLDKYGNSVFNSTLPTDSLALKYQKGYREYCEKNDSVKYRGIEKDDVIII